MENLVDIFCHAIGIKQSSSYPNFDLTVCGRLHDAEFNKNHIREAPVHFFTRRENLRRYRNLLAKTPDETVRSQLFKLIAKEERRQILQVISEREFETGTGPAEPLPPRELID